MPDYRDYPNTRPGMIPPSNAAFLVVTALFVVGLLVLTAGFVQILNFVLGML